ncbi:DHH family phosphoesterase [Aliikangiella sp. G2MR2-5]|uniref:DHH family phosphoesterase n=1 Tax=Aliikangiella sp. G2MR2-5 TaxID=2788943 RepID=UPI0018AAC003|nr:DHH family phosphoesterase [Aliikangiella sp. G2MR2-5]
MKVYDVFNGDADGIFSLIQLRKSNPVKGEHHLVTGVKRDIKLLSKIDTNNLSGSHINALDISFDKNVKDVERLLEAGASVFYCDHHKADSLFEHQSLQSIIDTSAFVCTGLLINKHIEGKHALWALAALFGDGLDKSAYEFAKQCELDSSDIEAIKNLGVLVNYNGYGNSLEDLHYDPADLYRILVEYDSPLDVIADSHSPYQKLTTSFESDLSNALACMPIAESETLVAIKLPNEAWSKRISGTYGNRLSKENPDKAVIIASDNPDGTLTISLRAPKSKPFGASDLCGQHPSGGGRASAAGINALEDFQLDDFISTVADFYAS